MTANMMIADGNALVRRSGPHRLFRLSGLSLLGLLVLGGLFWLFATLFRLESASLPVRGFLILWISIFFYAGFHAFRVGWGPRDDLRFDPASGRVSLSRHYVFGGSETRDYALAECRPPEIEKEASGDGPPTWALHFAFPDGLTTSVRGIGNGADAMDWRRRIAEMIDAARRS